MESSTCEDQLRIPSMVKLHQYRAQAYKKSVHLVVLLAAFAHMLAYIVFLWGERMP